MERILAVNPGATSTKVAVFDGETVVMKKTLEHQGTELKHFARVFDQYPYRIELIRFLWMNWSRWPVFQARHGSSGSA